MCGQKWWDAKERPRGRGGSYFGRTQNAGEQIRLLIGFCLHYVAFCALTTSQCSSTVFLAKNIKFLFWTKHWIKIRSNMDNYDERALVKWLRQTFHDWWVTGSIPERVNTFFRMLDVYSRITS